MGRLTRRRSPPLLAGAGMLHPAIQLSSSHRFSPWTAAACCRFQLRSLLRSNPSSRLAPEKRQQAAALHIVHHGWS